MISSEDLIKKANTIMEKIYFDGLTEKEQKIATDKILMSYTISKFKGLVVDADKFNNFIDLLIVSEEFFRLNEERENFYNNYTKLLINLMGKKQKMPITWKETDELTTPILKSRIATNIIDEITTSSKVDSLQNLNYIYNLYKSNMKTHENNHVYTIQKIAI